MFLNRVSAIMEEIASFKLTLSVCGDSDQQTYILAGKNSYELILVIVYKYPEIDYAHKADTHCLSMQVHVVDLHAYFSCPFKSRYGIAQSRWVLH